MSVRLGSFCEPVGLDRDSLGLNEEVTFYFLIPVILEMIDKTGKTLVLTHGRPKNAERRVQFRNPKLILFVGSIFLAVTPPTVFKKI